MIERSVGNSGLRASLVGLGCNNIGWSIGEEQSRAVVHKALDVGITLFDTSDFYGQQPGDSEALLGSLLKTERERVVLLTKFGVPPKDPMRFDNSRGYIVKAVEASLKRLRTDWIDIYMIHWPDPKTPIEETLRTLETLISSGKVRYIACSNLPSWRIADMQWMARTIGVNGLVAAQDEYSLINRKIEKDLLPALKHFQMGLIPYFPLASGLLTGKYRRGDMPANSRLKTNFLRTSKQFLTEHNLALADKLADFAEARGHSVLELAMSWLASNPLVSSIVAGATTPEQVEQNAKAVGWSLTDDDRTQIDKIR